MRRAKAAISSGCKSLPATIPSLCARRVPKKVARVLER